MGKASKLPPANVQSNWAHLPVSLSPFLPSANSHYRGDIQKANMTNLKLINSW